MTRSSSEAGRVREDVRRHYAAAATSCGPAADEADCCGPDGPSRFGASRYADVDLAAVPEAAGQASLGCGNPAAVADLHPGETVLDLGSGAGIDLLLSARRVGPGGLVYGLDMTDEMLAAARANVDEAGVGNVVLLRGLIEDVPLPADSVDVVISNCVVNLSPDKAAALGEVARVLRSGGRVGIVDVVAEDRLAPEDRAARGSQVSCLAGALSVGEYRDLLEAAGLEDVAITFTHEVADGMHGAIVRAARPAPAASATPPDSAKGPAPEVEIDALRPGDWPSVRDIYVEGMDTGIATVQTVVPDWPAWDAAHLARPRLVARAGGEVVGWAALSPVGGACGYRGVAEVSVYVTARARGGGIGRRLLASLVDEAERAGLWTLEAQIMADNVASLALHQARGFRTVGVRERIAQRDGRWHDVVLLERRGADPG